MTLPVSADYPIVPFVQYESHNPPFVPSVRTIPETVNMVPMVAALVANEAALKANQHAGRMFLYNLLANNFWKNQYFTEVVQLAVDIATLDYYKRLIRSPELGIQDAVVKAMGSYTSALFANYPDLKSAVAPQVLDAAYQNMHYFTNLKQEINSMYSHNPGNQMPPGHFHNPMGANAHAPMGHTGYGHPGNMHHGAMHPGMHYQHGAPGPAPWPSPVPSQNWGHHPAQSNYPGRPAFGHDNVQPGPVFGNAGLTDARFGVAPNEGGAGDRFASRPSQAPQQQPYEVEQRQTETTQSESVKKEEQKVLIIKGTSEMDRSKHRIALLGESYVPDTKARYNSYQQTTKELSQARPVDEDETEHSTVNYTWALEPCLEHAIVHGRVKQMKQQLKAAVNSVFRCFAVIATPLLCREDVEDYMKNFREANSFSSLAAKLKSTAMSLSMSKNEENAAYTDSVAMFLSQLDQILTKTVNEFIRSDLKLPADITCFSEDVSELPDYLYRKGGEYARAFEAFESNALTSLLCGLDDELLDDHMDNFDIGDMKYALLPITYSLTFVNLSSRELGYTIGNKPVTIDYTTAPILYKLADSLVTHKKQIQSMDYQMTVMHDLLITADDVRYKLYRSGTNPDEFLIAKA